MDAHRFYDREGMLKAGFHFIETITFNKVAGETQHKGKEPAR